MALKLAFCEVPGCGIRPANWPRTASVQQAGQVFQNGSGGPARRVASKPWCTQTRPVLLGVLQAPSGPRAFSTTAARCARLIQRPQRPYQFTQLVQLSDGSTFTVRTTSPMALHRSAKDSRNHILWQPSEKSLRNVEVDEAGKLAAFRSRFGRGWDAARESGEDDAPEQGQSTADASAASPQPGQAAPEAFDDLADLLSGYAAKEAPLKAGGLSAKEQARKDKKKKK